jgi:two-component sensor histidine kinase
MRALRSLTLLFALAGASTAHAEDKKPQPLSAEHAGKLLAFVNELVDTSVKHAGNCPVLATEIDGLVTRNIDTVNMMWAVKKQKQVVPPDVQAKLDKRGVELVTALRGCWNDERVAAAFKRMKLPKDEKK